MTKHEIGWVGFYLIQHCTAGWVERVTQSLHQVSPFSEGLDILTSVNAALHSVQSQWRIDVKDGQAIVVPTPEVNSAFLGSEFHLTPGAISSNLKEPDDRR